LPTAASIVLRTSSKRMGPFLSIAGTSLPAPQHTWGAARSFSQGPWTNSARSSSTNVGRHGAAAASERVEIPVRTSALSQPRPWAPPMPRCCLDRGEQGTGSRPPGAAGGRERGIGVRRDERRPRCHQDRRGPELRVVGFPVEADDDLELLVTKARRLPAARSAARTSPAPWIGLDPRYSTPSRSNKSAS